MMCSTRFVVPMFIGLAVLTGGAGCPTGPGEDAGPEPDPESDITLDGAAYKVDADASKLLVKLTKINSSGICLPTHGHAVEADAFSLVGELDTAAPGTSTLTLTIPAQLLKADLAENRALYEDLVDEFLSDADRGRIQGQMPSEVSNADNPNLVFTFSNLSSLSAGPMTADMQVSIKGTTATVPFSATLAVEGESFVLTEGSAVFTRGDFEILTANPFGGCLSDEIQVDLRNLTLIPGQGGPNNFDAGPGYVQQTFPYDGNCVDTGVAFNDELYNIVGRRCTGCHDEESNLPLVEYDDWRVDSPAAPGRARFEEASVLMELPDDDTLHMPPVSGATQLSEAEKTMVYDWFEAGAPPACTPPSPPVFTSVPREQECGSPSWTDDIEPMITGNFCVGCHDGSNPDVAAFSDPADPFAATYNAGLEVAEHPFYQPLKVWEVAVERIKDRTMPPREGWGEYFPVGATIDDDIAVLEAWIAAGYPQNTCP